MPSREKICTCNPQLEGTEVFASQKRKPATSIDSDEKTHRLDTVKFSRPHAAQRTTWSHVSPLPTIGEDSSLSMLEVSPSPSTGLIFSNAIAEQKSKMDKKLWHIVHILYSSSKVSYAMHAVTKKNLLLKASSMAKTFRPEHTLKFQTITNLLHLKLKIF